jgi:hypothetical protein
MKRILFSVFCGIVLIFAQGTNDVGKIALSVIIPNDVTELNSSAAKSRVETKIKQIVAEAGLGASGYDQSFMIYPNFAILQTDVVETGMQNLTKVTAELSLFIKQSENNILFASTSKRLVGTGKTKSDAVLDAIQKMPVRDAELIVFIEVGKEKIIQYYQQRCDDIIMKSDALVKRQEYEEAMMLLLSVPEEVSTCYQKVIPKTVAVYNAYQSKIFAEQMQSAKAKFAAKDYKGALDILSKMNPAADMLDDVNAMMTKIINQQCVEQLQIAKAKAGGSDRNGALLALESVNPTANCYHEAMSLLASISAKIAEVEKQEWDFKMQQYNDLKAIEQRNFKAEQEARIANRMLAAESIQAAKEVVVALINSKKR